MVDVLVERGIEVVAGTRAAQPASVTQSAILDLRFPYEIFKTVEQLRPDAVVALAYMRTDASKANPQMAMETNVVGINALFDACAALNVALVVYASSINVYGVQADFGEIPISEDMYARPRTLYGWTKLLNEAQAEHYNANSNTRYIGLRFSGIHGHGKRGAFDPFDRIVAAANQVQEITLPWSAELEFSFLHVDDAARIVLEIVTAKQTRWAVYNAGGATVTIGELADAARRMSGLRVHGSEPGDPILAVSRLDNTRLTTEFGITADSACDWLQRELAAFPRGGGDEGPAAYAIE